MTSMITPTLNIARGEVWEVRFNPSEGDEIKKIRPAVVMDVKKAGRMKLRIVVPITGWQAQFSAYFWMVRLTPTPPNGLTKDSVADAFQIKSVSIKRFQNRLGLLTDDEMDDIASAVALCIGYEKP
jgi:mRNA interferase MazF